MRRLQLLGLFSGLFPFVDGLPCRAAEPDRGVVVEPIAIVSGFGWESGGLDDPVHPGDELQLVGVLTGLEAFWEIPWQPKKYAYTFWAHSMLAISESVDNGRRVVVYSGGEFRIDRDVLPSNHEYGVFPPNATSPSTFADGESFLEGPVAGTHLGFAQNDGPLESGYVSLGVYTGGLILDGPNPGCGDCTGYLNITLFAPGAPVGPEIPEGYDFGFDGTFENYLAIAVQPATWGRLKALYR